MIRPAGLPGGDGADADCAGAVHAACPVGSRLPSDTGQFGLTRSAAIPWAKQLGLLWSVTAGLSSSGLASLANMSQELTGPHAPYMLIVHVFVEKIKSGELKPGDRVPSVTELVETYNVSHSTARRALAKLKEMSLTDTVPGYATFVRFPDQDGPS